MNTIKATWTNGHVQLDKPVDWPEGRRPVVAKDRLAELEFMTEDEQSDDVESIERWIAELDALPPVVLTADEEAELMAWRRKAKEFNLDAIRRQMESDIP